MKANRVHSALHGWENEDYERTQSRLKDLADKLSGKNRMEQQKQESLLAAEEKTQPKFEDIAKQILFDAAA